MKKRSFFTTALHRLGSSEERIRLSSGEGGVERARMPVVSCKMAFTYWSVIQG